MGKVTYREIAGQGAAYWTAVLACALVAAAGLGAALYMRAEGHHVSGMNEQIVWGMPHVFAVFLIVAASGALNVASIASVFGRSLYKPLARLSGLLAVALLIGGLWNLVLDLGRPGHILAAVLYPNFRSIFAWNIYLYTGFLVIVGFYLWFMMERRLNPHTHAVGVLAFLWRLVLTTGTGSIFGFLAARSAYDSAVMAPLFILMSFAFGLAIFVLVLMAGFHVVGRPIGARLLARLKTLLAVFVAGVMYFVAVFHLTNLYMAGHRGVESFLLVTGGIYPALFWGGQVLIGGVVPLVLLLRRRPPGDAPGLTRVLAWAAALVVFGGLCQVYVIIIGGQAYPLQLFPGMIVHSSFYDGVVHSYIPRWPETTLAVSGVAVVGLIVLLAVRLLPFLPESLADEVVSAHAPPPKAGEPAVGA
ncbi:NrfD/PsrC family molybdoenzyme membrane anchor subunit [Acidiferrobacter sp.]|uniref:NrfD/PsrC family molybdoenzyme membrane anchor subunit n=1 Tax=Acidiferrobacter sp. TaxID=1872107 RepID=UPI002617CEAE|nr:NrfD/PsrC family molybdoenzyme membrane anchor subunit [Acidiferrobacter sp.]